MTYNILITINFSYWRRQKGMLIGNVCFPGSLGKLGARSRRGGGVGERGRGSRGGRQGAMLSRGSALAARGCGSGSAPGAPAPSLPSHHREINAG